MKTQGLKKLALVLFLSLNAFAQDPITVQRCGGSDGPTPLFDNTANTPQNLVPIPTNGDKVTDFFVWENGQQIVYRTEDKSLLEVMSIDGSSPSNPPSDQGALEHSLSRVLDSDNKYIMAEGWPFVMNIKATGTAKLWALPGGEIGDHLFWNDDSGGDTLYSLAKYVNTSTETLSVIKQQNEVQTPQQCSFHTSDNSFIYTGKGHFYPDVFLYKKTQNPDSTNSLSFYSADVTKMPADQSDCPLNGPVNLQTEVPGTVNMVYWFVDDRYFAVQYDIDANHREIMWIYQPYLNVPILSPQKCEIYDFGSRTPMVLNKNALILAAWDPSEGTTLVNPRNHHQISVAPSIATLPMTEQNYWLTDDASQLYVLDPNSKTLTRSDLN